MSALAKYDITKAHPEFTELYQTTYRGVGCALVSAFVAWGRAGLMRSPVQRSIMRIQAVNVRTVERLIQEHLRMYLRGNGENHPK